MTAAGSASGSRAGVVVIGRNEGDRLRMCLEGLRQQRRPVVYVDSGSTDGSLELARKLCDVVVALDPSKPFSAARARNEGVDALRTLDPGLRLAQFLDGDCIVHPEWLDAAERALDADPGCAIVFGHLQERRPEATVYNRLCAMEWSSPAGPVADFGSLGGLMMVRIDVFEQLGGFRSEMVAGEDSEFGVRVGLAGHAVRKLDMPMASHDADIRTFAQWWRRSVRAGHAIGQRASLHASGPMRDCARQRRSTWFWGIALPLLAIGLAWPTRGFSLLLLGGYALLAWRIYGHRRRRGERTTDARLYTRYTLLAKFANGVGLLTFHLNQLRGRFRIIEYK